MIMDYGEYLSSKIRIIDDEILSVMNGRTYNRHVKLRALTESEFNLVCLLSPEKIRTLKVLDEILRLQNVLGIDIYKQAADFISEFKTNYLILEEGMNLSFVAGSMVTHDLTLKKDLHEVLEICLDLYRLGFSYQKAVEFRSNLDRLVKKSSDRLRAEYPNADLQCTGKFGDIIKTRICGGKLGIIIRPNSYITVDAGVSDVVEGIREWDKAYFSATQDIMPLWETWKVICELGWPNVEEELKGGFNDTVSITKR